MKLCKCGARFIGECTCPEILKIITAKFEPTEKDIATGDPQSHPSDITAQEAAHESGIACEEEDCQDCCGEFGGHEHDDEEGGYCLNCGHHPNA